MMRVRDLLAIDRIVCRCPGTSREEAIDELMATFRDDPRVRDFEEMREAVHARERLGTTAIGRGFAIPHARTESVRTTIAAFGRVEAPVDFQAPDGKPVVWVLLIVSNESETSTYIKLLGSIARMMKGQGLSSRLEKAGTGTAIHEAIAQEEDLLLAAL